MKTLLILLVAITLAACASLQTAGIARYSIKPFVVDAGTGAIECCEVLVENGKEFASLEAHIEKRGDNYTVDLKEQGVRAFAGQRISAGAAGAALDAVDVIPGVVSRGP